MNRILAYILLSLLSITSLFAQEGNLIFGGEANYNLPVGSLADRFNPGIGGSFYIGSQVSDKWTWVGKFEYMKFDDENYDELFKKIEAEVDEKMQVFKIPLSDLEMELLVAGLSAEARYTLIRNSYFETNLNFGFGFYYWESKRGEYKDEITVEDSSGQNVTIANLDVPELFQKDWSGTINIGIDFNVKIIEPVLINAGVNYKLLISELWPTLALDLENVSGLQFIKIGGGVKIKL
jgi:hypothetical protein